MEDGLMEPKKIPNPAFNSISNGANNSYNDQNQAN